MYLSQQYEKLQKERFIKIGTQSKAFSNTPGGVLYPTKNTNMQSDTPNLT
jgi:hypothetical protein